MNNEDELQTPEAEPEPLPDASTAVDAVNVASADVDDTLPPTPEALADDFIEPDTVLAPPDDPILETAIAELPVDDVPYDEPFAVAYNETMNDYALMGEDVDIDAALAAVASLSDAAAEREADENAAYQAPQVETATLLPMPPPVALRRGTPASLIPAALLIGSGAVLTFMTTSGTQIPTEAVAFGALVAVALLMLGYWLTARRWARGTFFFACLLLLSAAAVYAMTQPNGLGERGLPLLVIATGASLLLTALLTRPALRRALLPALLLIIAGGVALGFSLGLLDARLFAPLVSVAWVLPIILVVLWLIPLVFRRRAS